MQLILLEERTSTKTASWSSEETTDSYDSNHMTSANPPLIPETEYYPVKRKILPGQLIPLNPAASPQRRRFIETANKIIIGDITFDEGVLLFNNNHAEYRLRKLISGDHLNAGYDDLDYDYIRHKWAIRKDFYEKGYFKIMHPSYEKMFPDVQPKKLGRGGMITFINKDGSFNSISI